MKIELLEQCASDLNVVNAARVSLDRSSDWADTDTRRLPESDAALIGYLLRNRHGTPFEHGHFRFYVEAPIFVFREWHRHRIGHSYNEMSGRYTELEPRFYRPEAFRVQVGKPGAYTFEPFEGDDTDLHRHMEDAYQAAWHSYRGLLNAGVAKEQARAVLPVGIYSKMHWTCNPRSLLHFLSLRADLQAQQDIRDLACQAEDVLAVTMPVTHTHFVANGRVAP